MGADATPKMEAQRDEELSEFLLQLSKWFSGMGMFIGMTKSHWTHAPTGYVLMAQDLKRDSERLAKRARSLAQFLS